MNMKKSTVAYVSRYINPPHGWYVAFYWEYDHEKNPHDYDLYLTPAEWRKLSKLRSPKQGEVMKVRLTFEIVEE